MPPSIDPREDKFAQPELEKCAPDVAETSHCSNLTVLENIYRSEIGSLLAYFSRRLRGDDEPVDYVHETFARLAGHMARHPILDPRRYLRRIAQNLLFERTRRLRTRALHQCEPLTEELEPVVPPDQCYHIEADQVLLIYQRALNELPEKTREAFLLHRVDELTYKDIGERLGISIPTVQYHVARALAHIDAALEQE